MIDIGHPAHVHLFKNFAWMLQRKGHKILFTTKEKECCRYLLEKYSFEYNLLGSAKVYIVDKAVGLWQDSLKLLQTSKKFKPDLLLSHGSINLAFISLVTKKPHISLEDTGNMEQILLYKQFTKVILSPESLRFDFGRKHIKFRGYHELAYLHPKYFNPDRNVLKKLGVKEAEKFVILRFSAQAATHDFGYAGLPFRYKVKCAEEFSKYAKVFVSSEAKIDDPALEKFLIKIPPENMHDTLYYATLVYSEGAKTASEASLLGTPAIYVDFRGRDYIKEQEKKYGTIFNFINSQFEYEKSIQKGVELLRNPNIKMQWSKKREKILQENIDLTAFLIWFVENYPDSFKIMQENQEYQFRFR